MVRCPTYLNTDGMSASTIGELRRDQSKSTTASYVFSAIFVCATKGATSIFQSLKVTISNHVFNAILHVYNKMCLTSIN